MHVTCNLEASQKAFDTQKSWWLIIELDQNEDFTVDNERHGAWSTVFNHLDD